VFEIYNSECLEHMKTMTDNSIDCCITDPPYGILSDYEGYVGDQEYGGCFVFKFDPHNNHLEVMTKNLDRPNGIAFSHDEKKLYVADTGEDVKCLYVYDIIDNKILNQNYNLYIQENVSNVFYRALSFEIPIGETTDVNEKDSFLIKVELLVIRILN